MTREEAKEAAEVMIAYSQGATIWCRKKDSKDRGLICRDYSLNFNWEECDYKVYREREYRHLKPQLNA